MKVSHESPLCLMEMSKSYNDYDYCLVHLLEQDKRYLNFFEQSKKEGRHILLDNSMFELREAFEEKRFADWVVRLQPDEYIVPDVFIDSKKTMDNFESWCNKYDNLPGKKIGVVQGKDIDDMMDCYDFMSVYADKIAFSFECPVFKSIVNNPSLNSWQNLMLGRQYFINLLKEEKLFSNKEHHLLGAALPQEFVFYNTNGIKIDSIDTSNPIVAGIHKVKYGEYGLNEKISTKLADLIEVDVDAEMLENIKFNIEMFRKINKI